MNFDRFIQLADEMRSYNNEKTYEALEDEYSLMLILEKETNKLKEINRRILCQMQEI